MAQWVGNASESVAKGAHMPYLTADQRTILNYCEFENCVVNGETGSFAGSSLEKYVAPLPSSATRAHGMWTWQVTCATDYQSYTYTRRPHGNTTDFFAFPTRHRRHRHKRQRVVESDKDKSALVSPNWFLL